MGIDQRNNGQDSAASDKLSTREINDIVERAKNKSTRECEIELSRVAREYSLPEVLPQPRRKNMGSKAQLSICVDRDRLEKLKKNLGVFCDQELVEQLITQRLEQFEISLERFVKNPMHSFGNTKKPSKPRSISLKKRSIVFQRAHGKCENCESRHSLELDHKICVAKGGGSNLENLRLLCKSCNQRAAIKQLGLEKMNSYLNC